MSLSSPAHALPTTIFSVASSRLFDNGTDHEPVVELPSNWSSLIGIITAIVGNIMIALALNVQRYAHIRLHQQRAQFRERARQALKSATNGQRQQQEQQQQPQPQRLNGGYGTVGGSTNGGRGNNDGDNYRDDDDETAANESDPLSASFCSAADDKVASTYLKSPYWWLGQVLITVGEMGNFLAYGFAPASIVSPLGVVALISNCVIAPVMFKEAFRQRDFWGVIIAITGAVTVVLSAKQEETKLAPHDVWDAISTMEFEVYLAVTISLIVLLMWASPRYGNRTILVDLGLVGLYGGYTVLATKGVSSMLSSTLFGAFTTPVTYVLIIILLGTAVMQVRYVNKALQRFDSTQVIPIQFVMFTLCVIIGSAVLYRDFERTTAEQAAKFIGGCLLTFFGVFLITSGRRPVDDDEDRLSDEEGIEETIGLAEHGPGAPQTPIQTGRHGDAPTSRRSSRASRVSFRDTINKPLAAAVADSGVPSSRMPGASGSKTSLPAEGEEASPLLGNPWRESPRPSIKHQNFSAESVLSTAVASSVGGASEGPATPGSQHQQQQVPPIPSVVPPPLDRPVTPPRLSMSSSRPHSHHFQGPLISPSPLSSTVSAVVADTLLKHMDSPSPLLRKIGARRSRPSLRSSLFVPQDELDEEEAGAAALFQPLITRHNSGPDAVAVESDESNGGAGSKKGFRGRARSLSNTLTGLFTGKRRRRHSSPGTDDEGGNTIYPGAAPTAGEGGGGGGGGGGGREVP